MRIPVPGALLVEHPAVPVPSIDHAVAGTIPDGERVEARSLSRREKLNAALQLTAAVSLLGEFDLWPGRAAIRDALFVRTSSGMQACLAGYPVPMSRVFARLGGGEDASAVTRNAAVTAISDAVQLAARSIDAGKSEPGFFLEGAISRQLRELKRPLDGRTARALWAFRWDCLPVPEEGETSFWRVAIPDLARRLGGALWANIRHHRGTAWLCAAGDQGGEGAPVPAVGGAGTLILVGDVSNDELAAVSRWTKSDGCNAVVIGGFPGGWHAPRPPGFSNQNIYRHLAVTGLSLEDARRTVEQRAGRIDPLEPKDRNALTEAGRRVFSGVISRSADPKKTTAPRQLRKWLALAPDGLPPGFVTLQSGLSRRAIEDQRQELEVVVGDHRWRLVECPPLEPDPMHTAVADLFDDGDPKRALHRALGTGDCSDLETWARSHLDELDGFSVRDLLSTVAPGALGHNIGILLAEACLTVYDLSGARRALESIPSDKTDALEKWLRSIDNPPGHRRELPDEGQLDFSAQAVAESAILVLNEERRVGGGRSDEALELIDQARQRISDLLQRRIEIELAWIADKGDFDDPGWRRRVVGSHPVLRAHYAHRRARQLMDSSQTRSARRLLGLLAEDSLGPGFLGTVEHDLGAAALDAGESIEADVHQLRAYRLLQMAGFRHFTRGVLFNLAVGDLDQLEIRRAYDRFQELASDDPDDVYICGELVRLHLAKGDLNEFRSRLEEFAGLVDPNDPRFREALNLLQGVESLFRGELVRAHELLQNAGQEGEAWTGLADTLAGREPGTWQPDGWGVSLAAELVHDAFADGGRVASLHGTGRISRSHAFGIALAEKVARLRLPITETMRSELIRVLRDGEMEGWASVVAGESEREGSVVEALEVIVNNAGPEDLPPNLAARLLAALGVTGLELRDAVDSRVIWRVGEGAPGTEIRRGRIVVVPLGGESHGQSSWGLLAGVFDFLATGTALPSEPEADETGFYGISAQARGVRRELSELGPSHLPVLLVGETGVGKEVAARALHRLSRRRGAFVAVNIAAIPASLLEAELFGSVKGAFTGADRSRQGLAVAADRGTIFLDEVGDLDPPLQVKLLRFLEDQEVRAVGTTASRHVDVRIVSATHRDLARRVREGGFRQDLYYRIAAPPLEIPPLRERREDIVLLRDLFERSGVARHGLQPSIWSPEAEAILRRYDWPGNVRELRHAVEVALVRSAGTVVRPQHLPISETDTTPARAWVDAQREFRRSFLRAALKRNNGNRSATAREIGISRQALLYHLRNLAITD